MYDDWIRALRPRSQPTAMRLVCFPHAGGSATFYHPLSRLVDADIEILAVQYPGRQDRLSQPLITEIGTLADQVADVLAGQLTLPFAFFGHSMGAIVAFEVTRRLEERGLAGPAALFVSGRRAPSVVVESRVHLLDDAGVLAEMRRLNGTDARLLLDEEVIRMIMPSIRGDYTAIETYRCLPPSATVNCPVEALIGDDDSRVSVDQAKAWAGHTTAGFGLRVFPGGHFYLIDAAPEIAAHLADRLRVTPQA